MGFYETTYILHSALQEGRLSDIINAIEKKATSLGLEILFTENWGRKKLSYLIDKEKYGTYIFFQYKYFACFLAVVGRPEASAW